MELVIVAGALKQRPVRSEDWGADNASQFTDTGIATRREDGGDDLAVGTCRHTLDGLRCSSDLEPHRGPLDLNGEMWCRRLAQPRRTGLAFAI